MQMCSWRPFNPGTTVSKVKGLDKVCWIKKEPKDILRDKTLNVDLKGGKLEA